MAHLARILSVESKENGPRVVELYSKSAELGCSIAQYRLGLLYKNGTFVNQDMQKAVALFESCAAQDKNKWCVIDARKELFEFLQRRIGYASPEKSRENLSSFLNYKFEEDYGEEDRIFMLPGDIDYGRTKPGFKIVVDKGKNKFNANDVTGTLDISIVTDNGESILLDFPTKSCKMTYLLVLLTHKYSFGLPQELYDKDFRRKVVYSVWKILYKTITHYVEETQKYGLRRDCNFINNQTFAKDDRLSDSQRYWISVYTDTLADGNLTLRPRRIKLPADLIEIYDSSLRYSCHDIPSIDMYKSGYIQDDLRKHITPLKE